LAQEEVQTKGRGVGRDENVGPVGHSLSALIRPPALSLRIADGGLRIGD
jgi:hypothetical protein